MKTIPKTFKVKLSQTLVRSEHCYKGPFETIEALMQVAAFEGDYADCYETGSRWTFINDAWTNTKVAIPLNAQYVQQSEVSDNATPSSVVRYTDAGNIVIEAPTKANHAVTMAYVDQKVGDLDTRLDIVEDSIANPSLKISTI